MPKLEKSTSLYGGLGATTTLLFFMYIVGSLVVAAPVLNSSLHHELRAGKQGPGRRHDESRGGFTRVNTSGGRCARHGRGAILRIDNFGRCHRPVPRAWPPDTQAEHRVDTTEVFAW